MTACLTPTKKVVKGGGLSPGCYGWEASLVSVDLDSCLRFRYWAVVVVALRVVTAVGGAEKLLAPSLSIKFKVEQSYDSGPKMMVTNG